MRLLRTLRSARPPRPRGPAAVRGAAGAAPPRRRPGPLLLLALLALSLACGSSPGSARAGEERREAPPWRRSRPHPPGWQSEPAAAREAAAGSPKSEDPEAESPVPGAATAAGAESRAFRDLEALAQLGPRVAGTEGAARARELLRERLEALGAEVRELRLPLERRDAEPVELVHLIGRLPGASDDVVLLGAHYDSFPAEGYVGANTAASGPAAVLELGRRVAERERPYTVLLVLVDGDALPRRPGSDGPAHLGSEQLAGALAEEGVLGRVRVAFFFDGVADRDLRIARDLRSHRSYREVVWETARELGADDVFPPEAGFEAPEGTHRAFLDQRLRRVVALVDDQLGGDPAGAEAPVPGDVAEACSPVGLEVVTEVAAAALRRIERRLVKIDGFVASGRAPAETPEASPPGAAAPEASPPE